MSEQLGAGGVGAVSVVGDGVNGVYAVALGIGSAGAIEAVDIQPWAP